VTDHHLKGSRESCCLSGLASYSPARDAGPWPWTTFKRTVFADQEMPVLEVERGTESIRFDAT
jgi:hypothetical protein